jgi:hypothetical protein
MTDIPLSPFLSADQHPLSAETAVASVTSPSAAAAGLLPEPPSNEGRPQGAPASTAAVTVAAGDADATNHIHEIFVGARKWIDDDHRFVLDERAFMDAIEPMPLFLQRSTG